MLALVLTLTFVVLLLAVLVAGLLRSHADILKALHELGEGVGDPSGASSVAPHPHRADGSPTPRPVTMGPTLPSERNATSAPAIAGVTPAGDALSVNPARNDQHTLVAFLSSGCATCAGFWQAFREPDRLGLPDDVRLLVVTKGPDMEIPSEVRASAGPGVRVVMSTDAWNDYEVPGSPFFVLVDGRAGRRIGEGVANQFSQVAELVRRAVGDVRPFNVDRSGRAPAAGASTSRAAGLDGPERELDNDRQLLAAGIHPQHPSLYPETLDDVFPQGMGATPAAADRGS